MIAALSPSTVVQLDTTTVAYIIGTIVPLVTALVTSKYAPPQLKALVAFVLSILGGVLAAFTQNSGTLTVSEIVTACVQTYIAHAATYHALWKPTGIAVAVNAKIAPGVGIGPSLPPPPPVPVADPLVATLEAREERSIVIHNHIYQPAAKATRPARKAAAKTAR